ncbi:MAG: Stk1 family PASTA domain-containing Ser/Thr kinase [Clostridiales bacterium]|nr:Stk1 family PASTA domain-containing Ser/Thr kinase [Clostridiales bacterium]
MDKYIGKRLDGRYEIKELIGVGGMAYVYKAYDSIDDRTVAVKILKDEFLANEEFTRRFKNESKAIAILSHPNIVKVFDVSFGERLQYIVMEYIDGITLKEYIDQQKDIKWKEAVHFTVQILRALQHAHDKGIVHRDIKPQNIMLLPDGTIKVTDFGIARFSRIDIRATASPDKAIGSVHYISPEQARGEITDEKADIYSVGVMLYEMLTGRLPFEADNAVSVAIMQLQSEPAPPREINPQIPEGLEDITIKAMQKDPAKRYQSAAEMLYDIDEFKRNPSIHFEYKYFVDDTPTRFVEAITRVKGETPEGEEETEEEEEKKGPPVIPILAAVAGAFVLVAGLIIGVVFLLGIVGPTSRANEYFVPNLIGKDYQKDVVNNADLIANLKFSVQQEYSEDIPEGQIMTQDPKEQNVKVKSTVKLTVSKGPELIAIPQVTNTEQKDAVSEKLIKAGFTVKEIRQSSDTVQADYVIKTEPAFPDKKPKGTLITVFVSTGKERVPDSPIPNVKGTDQSTAIGELTKAGFTVDTEYTYVNSSADSGETATRGIVLSQSPEAETKAQPGTKVKLTLSSGYKDAKITEYLPATVNSLIDIRVIVNGELKGDLGKTGILPSALKTLEIKIEGMQEASYSVVVQISPSGANDFKNYSEYTVTGSTGTARLDKHTDYQDPNATTTTTANKHKDDD